MKIILWSVFGMTVLMWTAAAVLFGQILEWSIGLLTSGGVAALRDAALNLPVPDWLAPWMALTQWQDLVHASASILQTLAGLLPGSERLLSWLTPAIWVIWALGAALMLLLTGLISRFISS